MSDMSSMFPWLLPPPADFRQQIKALAKDKVINMPALRRLAATAMSIDQLGQMSKAITAIAPRLHELTPMTLALVGSHTLDYSAQALVATGVRHGLLLSLVKADYGLVMQSVLDPTSPIAATKPDAVLLSLDPSMLGLASPRLEPGSAEAAVDHAIAQVAMLAASIREQIGAVAVLQTLPEPADSLFGGFDARVAGSPRAMIAAFNLRLAKDVVRGGDLLIDVAFAAAQVGLDRWHDPRAWHSAKIPFSLDAVPLYADHICRVLGAAKGKSRKCLVLDLDNTVWGGIIGDDGLEGIRIGQGSAAGEAHLAVQELALDLRRRGIILAVCSKNEEVNALLPFREHKDMLLREEHIAAFVANWTDKAANLRHIAEILNIGTDALVFLDDNPAERAIVRQELPEVAVPEVGDDPALYTGMLTRAGYFEALSFGAEDAERAAFYQDNAQRKAAAGSATNLDEYLESLEMVLEARPFDAQGRSRIAQLINKSNQFNLTTRRYGENEVANFESDPNVFTLQVRLSDRFGDNGMISVIIFRKGNDSWEADTWLMSCRVLGRRVEQAVLAIVAKAALNDGAHHLIGRYVPSAKNALVKDHYAKLGFTETPSDEDGTSKWILPLTQFEAVKLPFIIE